MRGALQPAPVRDADEKYQDGCGPEIPALRDHPFRSRAHRWRLLDHDWRRDHGRLLSPFDILLALLVRAARWRVAISVEPAPLRLRPHVGVAREHGPRDLPSDAHGHLVTGPWRTLEMCLSTNSWTEFPASKSTFSRNIRTFLKDWRLATVLKHYSSLAPM